MYEDKLNLNRHHIPNNRSLVSGFLSLKKVLQGTTSSQQAPIRSPVQQETGRNAYIVKVSITSECYARSVKVKRTMNLSSSANGVGSRVMSTIMERRKPPSA